MRTLEVIYFFETATGFIYDLVLFDGFNKVYATFRYNREGNSYLTYAPPSLGHYIDEPYTCFLDVVNTFMKGGII